MKIFESHAHLDSDAFKKDQSKIIENCFKNDVEYIINIGCDEQSSKDSIALAKKYDQIYASVGYHPHDAQSYNEQVLRKLAKQKKVVAIGEIGLDYFRNYCAHDIQKDVFQQQIALALELKMPMIIHDRDAHEDCFDMLKEQNAKDVVFHCFAGDDLFAEKVLQEGWFISFTGTITYKNSKLHNVIRNIPMTQFFIETDSPYLTPIPHRGKRNNPAMLRHVIDKIAELKRKSPNEIADYSYKNAKQFFRIK
jgi:TatD DNase family protein